VQHVGPQQSLAAAGFVARTNALMNLPCTCGAMASTSILYTRVGSMSIASNPAALIMVPIIAKEGIDEQGRIAYRGGMAHSITIRKSCAAG
jgi:hypothetical protein